VVVKEKILITPEIAEKIKNEVSDDEIEVRGFLGSDYDYFDAHQEKVLVVAEANSKFDEF
jgi:hypothetical protein